MLSYVNVTTNVQINRQTPQAYGLVMRLSNHEWIVPAHLDSFLELSFLAFILHANRPVSLLD